MTANLRPPTTATCRSDRCDDAEETAVSFEELLELLGDEYACALVCALEEGPATAGELLDRCEMSRPTVYRRLNALTDAGIVDSQSSDGKQGTTYRLVVDCFEVRLQPDGVTGAAGPKAVDQ